MANEPMRKCSRPSEKCKSKSHRDTTTHTREWLKLKRLPSNEGNGVQKPELLYVVNGSIKWYWSKGYEFLGKLKHSPTV